MDGVFGVLVDEKNKGMPKTGQRSGMTISSCVKEKSQSLLLAEVLADQ
jgi:hypothetical protein